MLKYIKNHLETIAGIEIYPMISFMIFLLFFVGMAVWVWKADPGFIKKVSEIPLTNDEDND